MTTHELAKQLLEGPDVMVTISGYEGGVDEIKTIHPMKSLKTHVNDAWYYGPHEYDDDSDGEIRAIHLSN